MRTKQLIGVEYSNGEREIFFEYGTVQVEEKIRKMYGKRDHIFFDPSLSFGHVRNGNYKIARI